jgi:hypothetical protein
MPDIKGAELNSNKGTCATVILIKQVCLHLAIYFYCTSKANGLFFMIKIRIIFLQMDG